MDDFLQKAVARAEGLLTSREYLQAFAAYRDILTTHIVGSRRYGRVEWVLTQRVVELGKMLGVYDLADTLLGKLNERARHAGDAYSADYAAIQRILTLMDADRLLQAYHLLTSLAPTLGNISDLVFTEAGMAAWERQIQ